jgi:UDP-3-O-[3-hydroxymyristoyl] glucosamine N-acyltransferase
VTASADRERRVGGEGGSVLTASAIADLVNGTLRGDGGAAVSAVAPLDRAGPGHVAFCASARYASLLEVTRASVVLVAPDIHASASGAAAMITVEKPQDALLILLPHLYTQRDRRPGVHASVVIGRGARIGTEASIGPFVQIGEGAVLGDRVTIGAGVVIGARARVGADSTLHAGVTLYDGVELGDRVIVHSGAVLGSDGFGYVSTSGRHEKIPHVGRCVIEDDVEIGAGTTIDRGSIDDTVVGAGTKIDNLVHVAHNVRIGRLCLIAAQVGISGSARIEDGVVIGGQAGFQGHHTIGKGARIGGQSGVFGDVPAGETWSGYPARPHKESLRAQAALFRLAGMVKRLERLLDSSARDDDGPER